MILGFRNEMVGSKEFFFADSLGVQDFRNGIWGLKKSLLGSQRCLGFRNGIFMGKSRFYKWVWGIFLKESRDIYSFKNRTWDYKKFFSKDSWGI